MIVVPITFKEAAEFIRQHHRHHEPSLSAKFCLAVAKDQAVVGVAMVGRPVARPLNDGWTVEVTRTCTDGAKNANSMLYGAAWRAARALGYRRMVTYNQEGESGASLRAVGFRIVAEVKGRSWDCPSRPRVDLRPKQDKLRWEVTL